MVVGNVVREVRLFAPRCIVFVVVNVCQDTPLTSDYENFSVKSEYFTREEASELIEGFHMLGCDAILIDGEKDFLTLVLSGEFTKNDSRIRLVYSGLGAGTYRCRSVAVPAICKMYEIQHCGNDIYTTAVTENKICVTKLLQNHGFRVPETWYFSSKEGWSGKIPSEDRVLIAKPAYEFSSVGVTVESVSQLTKSFEKHISELSRSLRQPILVQEYIDGTEVEVPVFDLDKPFAPCCIAINIENSNSNILTYDLVECGGYGLSLYSNSDQNAQTQLQRISCDSFNQLGLAGVIRVDFRLDKNGEAYIIDYNGYPSIKKQQSCEFAIKCLGYQYADMLALLLYKPIIQWQKNYQFGRDFER